MSSLVCVVDASVAVKLFLAEPLANEAINLFTILATDPNSVFHVPDLFYVETANIFWKQVQHGARSPAQCRADHAALRSLRLRATPTFDLADDALALAAAHGVTAYDACYVALAQRLGVSFITADDKLVRKFSGSGFSVLWLGGWTPSGATP